MTNRLVPPYIQAIDANGDPISGAKLNTYFSGTSTPVTTYTDSDLTIAHTNPVVANARGEFPEIFLTPVEHRLTLTDADDVLIATYDPVFRSGIGSVSGGRIIESATASAGQTVFTLTNPYNVGANRISVYINGVFQRVTTNYTETDSTTITFTSALEANDFVVFAIQNTVSINIGTSAINITDDNFTTVTAPKNSGLIEVFAEEFSQAWGKLYFDVNGAAVAEKAYSGTIFDITTGALTGTTGTDGRITVSPHTDGNIYIENRLGSAESIIYSFIVAP